MQIRPSYVLLILFLPILTVAQQIDVRLMSSMPAQGRDDAVGFSVDGVGYILGGRNSDFGLSNQLWAYYPEIDLWEQKGDFPGLPRQYVSSFILDGQAHIIGGFADPDIYLNEHWRYDHQEDTWTELSNFPSAERFAGLAFELDGTAYFGTGKGMDSTYSDLWQYDSMKDSWEQVPGFSEAIYGALAVEIAGKVYVSGGIRNDNDISHLTWLFDGFELGPSRQLEEALANSDVVSSGKDHFLLGGRSSSNDAEASIRQLKEVNGEYLTWTRTGFELPLGGRRNGASFSIADNGYYFGGKDGLGVKSNELVRIRVLDHQNEALRIYPNPADKWIIAHSERRIEWIGIYDLSGGVLLEINSAFESAPICIDLNGLDPGMYIVRTSNAESSSFVITE